MPRPRPPAAPITTTRRGAQEIGCRVMISNPARTVVAPALANRRRYLDFLLPIRRPAADGFLLVVIMKLAEFSVLRKVRSQQYRLTAWIAEPLQLRFGSNRFN